MSQQEEILEAELKELEVFPFPFRLLEKLEIYAKNIKFLSFAHPIHHVPERRNYDFDLYFPGICRSLASENTNLEALTINDCEIGDEGCIKICKNLKKNKTLTCLNLSINDIGIRGLSSLCDTLQNNTTQITELDLTWCEIGYEGCSSLSKVLSSKTSLISQLTLECCSIGPEGLKQLCEALESADFPKLDFLNLANNNVQDEGCSHLEKFLKHHNCVLSKIILWGNGITTSGAKSLVSALTINNSLKDIEMRHNEIDDEIDELCNEVFKTNISLHFLKTGIYEETKKGTMNLRRNQAFSKVSQIISKNFVGHALGDQFSDVHVIID